MTTAFSARCTPLAVEARWSLENGNLIERRSKITIGVPLSALTQLTLAPAQGRRPHPTLTLQFGCRQIVAPSASLGPRGGGPRIAEFAAFTPALAAQAGGANPKVRFVLVGQPGNRSPLIWTITLLAIGTVGLALAARLAFCALMLAAALPWLRTETQALDLLAIPQSILPR